MPRVAGESFYRALPGSMSGLMWGLYVNDRIFVAIHGVFIFVVILILILSVCLPANVCLPYRDFSRGTFVATDLDENLRGTSAGSVGYM